MMTTETETELTLFVYIIGLDDGFYVRISSSKFVYDLKRVILGEKSNVLKDLDADQLSLYKVSLLDDDNLKKVAEDTIKGETPLRFSWKLSDYFGNDYWQKSSVSKTVHVLVEVGGIARESSYCLCPFNI
jgi:hypothetical protein